MNWLSVVILAVIVLCIFQGLRRGMVRSAFSLISVILTLFFGSLLNPYMSRFLTENTPIYDTVQEKCEGSITAALENKEEQDQFISGLPLPESMKQILAENNNEQSYQTLLAETFSEYLSHSIAKMAIGSISLIFTFLLVSMFMNLLVGMLDGIFSLPVLSLLNRAGGAVLGAVQGIFVVWICFLIITLFWDAAWAQEATALIKENEITYFLYENNILLHFMSEILH
nr:CvpA family protein [uncultured Blautia sp.]